MMSPLGDRFGDARGKAMLESWRQEKYRLIFYSNAVPGSRGRVFQKSWRTPLNVRAVNKVEERKRSK